MDILFKVVSLINEYLSDYVLIILLLGAGLYFSIKTRFIQVRAFPEGWKNTFGKLAANKKNGVSFSFFQALTAAVAAQVGTGNIVGASGAILTGGPVPSSGCGSQLFWGWQPSMLKLSLPSKPGSWMGTALPMVDRSII